jgi:hypothetical protein
LNGAFWRSPTIFLRHRRADALDRFELGLAGLVDVDRGEGGGGEDERAEGEDDLLEHDELLSVG